MYTRGLVQPLVSRWLVGCTRPGGSSEASGAVHSRCRLLIMSDLTEPTALSAMVRVYPTPFATSGALPPAG